MNTASCKCEQQTTRPSVNERPRYYARQLITPDDLTLEQDYFRTKLRRHNRFLHGWGVVCGAEVVKSNRPWKVIVRKGYILGPYGDEIYVETPQCVDVRRSCTPSEPQLPPGDPDCVEAQPPPPADGPLYIAIRYEEKKTRLVRVPLGGCGCEENACEHSRFSDGYEICVLDHCPDLHDDTRAAGDETRDYSTGCPECPTEPWVVLGEFTVNDEGEVTLHESECRRPLTPPGERWVGRILPRENLEPRPDVEEEPPPAPAEPAPPLPAPA